MKKLVLFITLSLACIAGYSQTQAQVDQLSDRYVRAAQISDDPTTGFGRVAVFEYLTVSPELKKVHIGVKIFQYKNDSLVANSSRVQNPYSIILKANNGQWVDTNGVDVPYMVDNPDTTLLDSIPQVINPDAYKTEYDFYIHMADNPINIFSLVLQQIIVADTRKRFDE